MSPTLEGLATRVEQLERSNRNWRRACLSVLVCAGAVVFMGQDAGSPKITAESLSIVSEGKVRARISVARKGNASLTLLDAEQKPRTILSVSSDGNSKLSFLDESSKHAMTLSMPRKGNPVLLLKDEGGIHRVGLGTDPAQVVLKNEKNQTRAILAASPKDGGTLVLKDAQGDAKKP